jgi:UDP-N-acetylglucosamine 2-epimerase
MRIAVVIGTRPTFIELAPLIHELRKIESDVLVYHTGQHYDKEMSDIFLQQLNIPEPKYNLHGSGESQAQQIATIVKGCESALLKDKPDLVIVEGDTTSAFASALATANSKIPVVHVEAGCRSFDKTLPEEVNRVLISHIANLHFAPTHNCKTNLLNEGIKDKQIHLEGHPIVDSINMVKEKLRKPESIDPKLNDYYYVTLHRDFNVDTPSRLEHILGELVKVSKKKPVIFPVHPRTRKRIDQFGLAKYLDVVKAMMPVDYITSLSLIKNAYAIISDSGGLTKEGCLLGTPCITLRPNTEWIETLNEYSNQLAFSKGNSIMTCVQNLDRNYDAAKQNIRALQGLFGSAGVSARIARIISSCDPTALLSPQNDSALAL